MNNKRIGSQTIKFEDPPAIAGYANIAGSKEGKGPLAKTYDFIGEDNMFGEKTWEKSESRMQKDAFSRAANKANISAGAIDLIYAGDLLNQCIGTAFGLRELGIPFYGLYGACSTMSESLSLAAMAIDGGFAACAAALTSSHYCSAERQFRLPLTYGGQRTPTAQWTVTGAGCVILSQQGIGPYITYAATGKIADLGIKDAANMGAAMAPAAYETLSAFFVDTATKPADYDLIVTGDLGMLGRDIVIDMFRQDGIDLALEDCGCLVYDTEAQDVHMGGSGCGCSAIVLTGHILNNMRAGNFNKVLFAGTGALLSPVSTQQGESVPSICHAVCIENTKG